MSPTYQQQPTLQNARIRTAQDALQVFFAVARNVLTLLTRRLDADERKAIRSGNVYIWEDRSASTVDNGGLTMERWTDGMSWGPSRIREEFLFYYQRDPAQERLSSGGGRMSFPLQDSDKLIKQTYSVYVFLPEDRGQDITRKWHLTAYFNQRTVDELTPIEDVPNVGRFPVPDGLFKSARATKSKREDPKRIASGTPAGSDSYTLSSDSGALYTIFPSSGNGPQTAHAYTKDGTSRSHPLTPVSAEPSTWSGPSGSGVPNSRSPHRHSAPSQTLPRPVPTPVPTASQMRLPGVRHPPSLVPLEYLQSCSNTRDPTDERMLQQLSTTRAPTDPSKSPIGPGANVGRMTPYSGFRSP
ncbi:Gti1/Pac2 family-domain-containing protein [Multifurca ochricompacta]|uniref:Gti1/Pac2 family-domain-containing protein n=1 Tax=Multifurca ochricompacta TaxID=376703 RepID=A0AAD4M7R5_9AGAM|nr:Gti1/Pac2 family-domain-containing protein [Multifurca ochricompacta]